MKILALSDIENDALWKYFRPEMLDGYDLIISCGDLNAHYLSYLVTMASKPVLYVHGNHDSDYVYHPPEGCDCIDDQFVVYNGIRIMGLGSCLKYHDGPFHCTESEMKRRISRMYWYLWKYHGVDIVVTHAPPRGLGDLTDRAHLGFESFLPLLEQYHPQFLLHGHVHLQYDCSLSREIQYQQTRIVNVFDRYAIEIEDRPFKEKDRDRLLYKSHAQKPCAEYLENSFHFP